MNSLQKGERMKYEIKGGAFPVVVCYLNKGEQMITEKGSMVWQTTDSDGDNGRRPREDVF